MLNKNSYVLIIGSSNMDLNIYSKRLPNPGETVTGGVFRQFLGGKGANQSVASVRSGAKTIFIGKIGVDSFGDQMISRLTNEGVDITHIIRDPNESSGVAFILIDDKGENMISVAPGANFKLTLDDIELHSEVIRNARCLVVQMEIPIEVIEKVFEIALQGNVIKILNPAPFKPIPPKVLKNIDIIVPNEGELFLLYSSLGYSQLNRNDNDIIFKVSKEISKLGIKYIITTLGKKGCSIYLRQKEKNLLVPAPKVEAVDTVGAGDCFIGVLASKLSREESIINAVKYATVAASIAVTRRGAQDSMPFLQEIEDKMNKLNIDLD